MKLSEIQLAIQKYVEAEMIPVAKSDLQKVLTYAGLTILSNKLPQMAAQYGPMAQKIGIVDENGDYDTALLHEALATAVDKVGLINVAGMIFRKSDIDTFFNNYLK